MNSEDGVGLRYRGVIEGNEVLLAVFAPRPHRRSNVVMTADTLAVIWRAVAKAYPTSKRHGLPGCRHSQGSTLFVSFDRAGMKPGAVLFELLVPARCGFLATLDLIRPPPIPKPQRFAPQVQRG